MLPARGVMNTHALPTLQTNEENKYLKTQKAVICFAGNQVHPFGLLLHRCFFLI